MILQVKIHGFKSYKEQNTPEPFDSTLNVVGRWQLQSKILSADGFVYGYCWCLTVAAQDLIADKRYSLFAVGANGSGKSNFFHGVDKALC